MPEGHNLQLADQLTLQERVRRAVSERLVKPVLRTVEFPHIFTAQIGGTTIKLASRSLFDISFLRSYVEGLKEGDPFVEALSLIPNSGNVLDIGASVGIYSSLALKRGFSITALEPDPSSFERLLQNTALNSEGDNQCRVCDVAVGNSSGQTTFFTDGYDRGSPGLEPTSGQKGSIEVDLITLDELILQGIIPRPDLIKIDVEGAEDAVLSGGDKFLAQPNAPLLVIEAHPLFLGRFHTDLNTLRTHLIELGYTIVREHTKGTEIEFLCSKV